LLDLKRIAKSYKKIELIFFLIYLLIIVIENKLSVIDPREEVVFVGVSELG
jgi:hypothetical protein